MRNRLVSNICLLEPAVIVDMGDARNEAVASGHGGELQNVHVI